MINADSKWQRTKPHSKKTDDEREKDFEKSGVHQRLGRPPKSGFDKRGAFELSPEEAEFFDRNGKRLKLIPRSVQLWVTDSMSLTPSFYSAKLGVFFDVLSADKKIARQQRYQNKTKYAALKKRFPQFECRAVSPGDEVEVSV